MVWEDNKQIQSMSHADRRFGEKAAKGSRRALRRLWVCPCTGHGQERPPEMETYEQT